MRLFNGIGVIIISFIGSLFAAQAPVKKPAIDWYADKVIIRASDGQRFAIDKESAFQSPTIKALADLSEFQEKGIVNLATIDTAMLKKIIRILNAFYNKRTLQGKRQLDAVEFEVRDLLKETDRFALLDRLNFLDFIPGIQLFARYIARNQNLIITAQEAIRKGKLHDPAATEIARYYYLLKGQDLPEVDGASYGFSIQDYLDYRPQMIEERRKVEDFRTTRPRKFSLQNKYQKLKPNVTHYNENN